MSLPHTNVELWLGRQIRELHCHIWTRNKGNCTLRISHTLEIPRDLSRHACRERRHRAPRRRTRRLVISSPRQNTPARSTSPNLVAAMPMPTNKPMPRKREKERQKDTRQQRRAALLARGAADWRRRHLHAKSAKLQAAIDVDKKNNQPGYRCTIHPRANHVLCETTGKVLVIPPAFPYRGGV